MKWVTYRSDHGERTGVLSGDAIYAMPPDVSLLDLVGRGATVCARRANGQCAHRPRW